MPISSLLSVRLGVVEPQIVHLPPDVASLAAAEEAIELADAYGICDGYPLAESQRITLRGALAERADGSWAATRVGDFGPRQGAGKTDKIHARELAGLILFGERLIIHSAHEFPTANEAFLRLVGVFENWDDLRRKVKHIYYANGAQSIELFSGQRLLYKTRTGGNVRGFSKADLVVYDEAQMLGRAAVAASGPSKLANPNAQSWFAGSGGMETSAVAWEIRRAAILGTGGRLAYTEATAETVTVVDGKIRSASPDPADLDAWYRGMPGLGRWVTEESMRAVFDELGPDAFARECLCVWDPEPGTVGDQVIPLERWHACLDARSAFAGPPVFAVDVTPDRSRTSIAAAGVRADGLPHVEIVENRPGTGWAAGRLAELKAKWRPKRLLADASGPAGSLIGEAAALGVEIEAVSTREYAASCGRLFDWVSEGFLRHRGDPLLEQALLGATKRSVGDAWLWDRRTALIDISPLVAATLAVGAVAGPAPVATFASLDDFLDDGG